MHLPSTVSNLCSDLRYVKEENSTTYSSYTNVSSFRVSTSEPQRILKVGEKQKREEADLQKPGPLNLAKY